MMPDMMAYGEPSPFRRRWDKGDSQPTEGESLTAPPQGPQELATQPVVAQTQTASTAMVPNHVEAPQTQSSEPQESISSSSSMSTTDNETETSHTHTATTTINDPSDTVQSQSLQSHSIPIPRQAQTEVPHPASPRVVPTNFFESPIEDLIVLVSSMLEELVAVNDALPFDPQQLTRFHSRSPPGISVKDYLVRIVRFCSLEKSILLTVIYYIDFLCRTFATFNINSLTVHRFLITTCMVGSKGLCDSFRTNGHYARVGGISKAELNLLEVEFLVRVDYRIVPKVEVLSRYYERMVLRMNKQYRFETTPAVSAAPTPTPTTTSSLPSVVAASENREPICGLKRGSIAEDDPERVKRSLEGNE